MKSETSRHAFHKRSQIWSWWIYHYVRTLSFLLLSFSKHNKINDLKNIILEKTKKAKVCANLWSEVFENIIEKNVKT